MTLVADAFCQQSGIAFEASVKIFAAIRGTLSELYWSLRPPPYDYDPVLYLIDRNEIILCCPGGRYQSIGRLDRKDNNRSTFTKNIEPWFGEMDRVLILSSSVLKFPLDRNGEEVMKLMVKLVDIS